MNLSKFQEMVEGRGPGLSALQGVRVRHNLTTEQQHPSLVAVTPEVREGSFIQRYNQSFIGLWDMEVVRGVIIICFLGRPIWLSFLSLSSWEAVWEKAMWTIRIQNTRNIFCWAWEELRKDKAACLFKLRWMPQGTTSRSSDPGSPRTKPSSWKIQAYHQLKLTCISLPQDGWAVPTASNLPAVNFLFLDSRMASTLNAETVSTYLTGFLCFLKWLEERLGLCHFTLTSQHSSDV